MLKSTIFNALVQVRADGGACGDAALPPAGRLERPHPRGAPRPLHVRGELQGRGHVERARVLAWQKRITSHCWFLDRKLIDDSLQPKLFSDGLFEIIFGILNAWNGSYHG